MVGLSDDEDAPHGSIRACSFLVSQISELHNRQ
jgi:hypothetical protein